MPGPPPDGEPAPTDGQLPVAALERLEDGPWGIYLHVPFCRRRCGYCDFNTYTYGELSRPGGAAGSSAVATGRGGSGQDIPPGGSSDGGVAVTGRDLSSRYVASVGRELELAVTVLGSAARPVETVFVGGGTPTLLAPEVLVGLMDAIGDAFGLADGAEVTIEANPDTVTPAGFAVLARGGVTRVSLGMQSAVPHVLTTLDRTHDPVNVTRAVGAARAAGLATSVDLIYGTPGESLDDWRTSLEAALVLEPDHVSAYALVVEEGTRLAAQVRRGEVAAPRDDDEAAKYELADEMLTAAGFDWYELSNWARTERGRCRHNEGYWRGGHWWGLGPGAHSHIGGVRWWNVRHPAGYAERLEAGRSPAQGREVLTEEQRYVEDVLLRSRLAEGLPLAALDDAGRAAVPGLIEDCLIKDVVTRDGMIRDGTAAVPTVVLTRRGRLLADTVVRRLLDW